MIDEIAPGIYTAEHRVAEGKNAIVFGSRRAWAIDTGIDPAEGATMADFIRSCEAVPDRLIYTHGHGDHILGSAAFCDAEVIAHCLMPVECRRLLPGLARRNELSVEEMARRIVWPTITFSDHMRISLGGRHLQLFPTPGHSQDGISVLVEEAELLIAGDAVVTCIPPAIGNGDSYTLETSLHRLMELEVEILIPGHGPVVYGRLNVQDWLRWLADYLAGLRDGVHDALRDGLVGDEILVRLSFDRHIGSRLPRDRHSMERRHRDTALKIVKEEAAS